VIDGAGRPGAEAIGNSRWIKVQELADPSTLAKAIALALELDRVLLIDERAGRREAALHGVTMISSLTILEVAKSRGFIAAARPILDDFSFSGFRLSNRLRRDFLARLNEH
jgi:predicted nucleic acid-binding protein